MNTTGIDFFDHGVYVDDLEINGGGLVVVCSGRGGRLREEGQRGKRYGEEDNYEDDDVRERERKRDVDERFNQGN